MTRFEHHQPRRKQRVLYLAEDVDLVAPADEGDVGALLDDLGLADLHLVVPDGHLLHGRAVQDLRLEEDHRVGAAYTGQQQALRVGGATVCMCEMAAEGDM